MMQTIPGGAAAKPFITHHNALDMDLYLRVSPELYLKRLVVGGFERVFEINRNFRNEGVSTKHNPEFTMLEFYMAHGDYKKGMEFTENIIRYAIQKAHSSLELPFKDRVIDYAKPFERLTVYESLIKIGGLSEKDISKEHINETLRKHESVISPAAHYGEKLWVLFE